MSRLFAFADKVTGEVDTILDVGLLATQYVDGQETDTHILLDVTDRDDVSIILDQRLYLNGEWRPRPTRPGIYHSWDHEQQLWVFNAGIFLLDVRSTRDKKLLASDWTQMPDSPLTSEQRTAWATYRQALRELPATLTVEETMEEIAWPTPP